MPVYVIVIGREDGRSQADDGTPLDFPGETVTLSPSLFVCDTQATRSRLYHDVKKQLAKDTPLFVGALSELPKFKGMADGSTKAVGGLFAKA